MLQILDYVTEDRDLIRAEKHLLKDIYKRMLEADVWLSHYGRRFDIPFINSRLLYHGLKTLPANYAHIDTWRVARNHLKLRNNRLVTISEFLGTKSEKDAVLPEQWLRALGGHRQSMQYIVNHCKKDCLVLEEVYNQIRPLILEHPNRGVLDGRSGCGICGSKRLQKRGFHLTRTRKYQRYQCQDCGSWSKDPKPVKPVDVLAA